jgi:hypothetical protein
LDLQNKKNGLYGELVDFLATLAKYLTIRVFFSQRNIYLRIKELVPTSYPSHFTDGIHDSNMQQAATNNNNKTHCYQPQKNDLQI